LASRRAEPGEVNAERENREFSATVDGFRIAHEHDAEVTPSFRPESIHLSGRCAPAEKTFIFRGWSHSSTRKSYFWFDEVAGIAEIWNNALQRRKELAFKAATKLYLS
jgi:hypothetical protein